MITVLNGFNICLFQGGYCPGNQGRVRESEKGRKYSGKSQGIGEKKGI